MSVENISLNFVFTKTSYVGYLILGQVIVIKNTNVILQSLGSKLLQYLIGETQVGTYLLQGAHKSNGQIKIYACVAGVFPENFAKM